MESYYQNPENYFEYFTVKGNNNKDVTQETVNNTQGHTSDKYSAQAQNKDVSQEKKEDDIKNANNEKIGEVNTTYLENRAQRIYSDFLVDGIPIWELECRGMTEEEAQAFRNEVEGLNKDKDNKNKSEVADMAD